MIGQIFARLVFPAFVLLTGLEHSERGSHCRWQLWFVREWHAVRRCSGQRIFQEEGANVTGIISSQGGGTSVRNAMAGVAYGEANPGAIAVAIQQGADIKIVSDNVLTIAEFAWMVKKDSPIKTIKDLKGKKIGYTNPRSTSQALAILLLQKAGYKAGGRGARQDRRFRPDARRARSRPDRCRAP